MILRIHPEAIREFEKALLWYRQRSSLAPQKLRDEVGAASKRILANPQLFPIICPERRRALLQKFPYFIVFEWTPENINIIAIAHAKRKTAYWRKRQMHS